MVIGIPKEIKDNEKRVAIAPAGVKELISAGAEVLIETCAGIGSGIDDEVFEKEGAKIVKSAKELFDSSELIVKVKEPLGNEIDMLKKGQAIFTYLHLASSKELTEGLLSKGVTAVAYETVQDEDGFLPLLFPMSEIAGKMSVQAGAYFLQKNAGGRGVLLGGVPGVSPANVLIIGAGTVGTNAAKIAVGMGARVTVMDKLEQKLVHIDELFSGKVKTLISNEYNLTNEIKDADLIIGAVLVPGGRAPIVITREMLKEMKRGTVIVDVAIDQGGCVETSMPTTYSDPVFTEEGIIHYCVTNIPGAVSMTSTFALTNATLGYVMKIAGSGLNGAIREDMSLKRGVNIVNGHLTSRAVSDSLNMDFTNIDDVID